MYLIVSTWFENKLAHIFLLMKTLTLITVLRMPMLTLRKKFKQIDLKICFKYENVFDNFDKNDENRSSVTTIDQIMQFLSIKFVQRYKKCEILCDIR